MPSTGDIVKVDVEEVFVYILVSVPTVAEVDAPTIDTNEQLK